jgi:integrase
MPRTTLSKRTIDALKPAATPVLWWDQTLPRFGLRLEPSGVGTFVVQYRIGGRSRRCGIGQYGRPWTPNTARTEAMRLLGLVAQGQDPATEKRVRREGPIVRELAERFVREHVTPKLKVTTAREVRRLLDALILPKLGTFRVADVETGDLARLHHQLRGTPYQANRVLAACSKLFSLAERWRMRAPSTNPARGIEKYRERGRRRYLTADELGRLGTVLDTADQAGSLTVPGPKSPRSRRVDVFAIAALRLLILTGARLEEILGLRWTAVDLEHGVLRLTDSKTGQKDVQLNGPALAVLRSLPRVEDSPFVILGKYPARPRADGLKGPWTAIRTVAGIQDVRIHDLRHSYASIGVNAGLALPLLGGLLGHKSQATTQRYAHLQADPLRVAAEQIGHRLVTAMGAGR